MRLGSQPSKHDRLGRIAVELGPRKRPYWVSQPGGRHPAQGWYWIPAGMDAPTFLGHNNVVAETALRALIDGHYRA